MLMSTEFNIFHSTFTKHKEDSENLVYLTSHLTFWRASVHLIARSVVGNDLRDKCELSIVFRACPRSKQDKCANSLQKE